MAAFAAWSLLGLLSRPPSTITIFVAVESLDHSLPSYGDINTVDVNDIQKHKGLDDEPLTKTYTFM